MNTPRPVFATLKHWILVTAVVAMLGACAGCVTDTLEGVTLLRSANADYENSRFSQAETQAALFIQRYHSSPVVAEAYYVRGMARFQQQQYAGAEADFNLAVESKRTDLTAKAHWMLGRLAMQREDAAAAVTHFREAIKGLPEGTGKAEVYYRYAVALRRLGQWDEARPCLARVVDGYPQTEWAQYARRQLNWQWRYFSIQCGAFRLSKNAIQEVARLRQFGLDARQEMIVIPGGDPQYYILVGQYASYREARTNLARVQMVVKNATVMP
jgi:tetratricopeptide (TPR) repeat protein